MRGHFRHLHFKTFAMTPRTPQCEVFWPFNSSSEFLGVPEDSKFPLLGVWASPSQLDQSGVVIVVHIKGIDIKGGEGGGCQGRIWKEHIKLEKIFFLISSFNPSSSLSLSNTFKFLHYFLNKLMVFIWKSLTFCIHIKVF
jgi:hypothetical protein